MRPTHHLTLRVAWHDAKWAGTVCSAPTENSFCVMLDRIREEREEEAEKKIAGRDWSELPVTGLPPCKAESGIFMNPNSWVRQFVHPYVDNKNCKESHGDMKPRLLKVPSYTAIAVPFRWMLRNRQTQIDAALPQPLPPDEAPPFGTAWVFGRERQCAVVEHVFGKIENGRSLVFFYTKEGHPVGDGIRRLVVGVGLVEKLGKLERYDSPRGPAYPLWDRLVTHSIRPDGIEGFLLPYHEYVAPTGNEAEDLRRQKLVREIAVEPDPAHQLDFSYAAEVTGADVALSTLVQCLAAVQKIREHGIAEGPWQEREAWLNSQIAAAWTDRGHFPGIGAALEALGMRIGTALVLELRARGALKANADPWPYISALLDGSTPPPQPAYAPYLNEVKPVWQKLPTTRRTLLQLISRFDLTAKQAVRFFDPTKRTKSLSRPLDDEEIIRNPYLLAECDLGSGDDSLVGMTTIDRGLLPDASAGSGAPVPIPSRVESPSDPRRVRCAVVSVLLNAARDGDSLLSIGECQQRLEKLRITPSIDVNTDWLRGHAAFVGERVRHTVLDPDGNSANQIEALQLAELAKREEQLGKVLRARAQKVVPSTGADWPQLIAKAIKDAGGTFDAANPRHVAAAKEQSAALEKITTRRLSVLVGQAGTGKTSTLGAMVSCPKINREGLLLLAPTGKARVRLSGATGVEAMTVAQFLNSLGRFDGNRQRPLFEGDNPKAAKYSKAKTVVIDEASMLTMDYLQALLEGVDQTIVSRIVLVGDPNQLPPIGVGRPFVDLVAYLENSLPSTGQLPLRDAIGRLTVEVRTKAGAPSDALRLASWFTNTAPGGEAERVMCELGADASFNDLEVVYWKTPQDLRSSILSQFQKQLGLSGPNDVAGFNKALGYADEGWIKYDDPDGVENFQILSPIRPHPYGVSELNRWIQGHFRARELEQARQPWGTKIGDEAIVAKDKVIQLVNEKRTAYDRMTKTQVEVYIANGEIGGVASGKSGFLNVYFAGRKNIGFGYRSSDFGEDFVPLELAYALTIHKSQGSQFKTVFVVVPKSSRLLSRELIYTALTRAREKLVLLVEGDSSGLLYDLSKPERSDAVRRNTNLFSAVVRRERDSVPYAENLIHRTSKGHMVRSKSELVIANMLFKAGVPYEYEKALAAPETRRGKMFPDFNFSDASGDLLIWEHFGRMDDPNYVNGRDWKMRWYSDHGYKQGENLFVTEETQSSGLDSTRLEAVVAAIKARV